MTTKKTIIGGPPPVEINGSATCGNGHEWRHETTRWRWRDRTDRPKHGWAGWERDCLVCKAKSNSTKERRTRR